MSGTVIEQLTTKLGLDVSEFKKGIGEAKKSMDELKGSGEEAGNSIGNMIGAGAKRATGGLGALGSMLGKGGAVGLGIGAAIYFGKKLDDTLFRVAGSLRQLGIEAPNIGKTAAGLRNLQNASELAGGSLEDATQTVGDLQKSLYNLRFNGQVSDQIIMLSRLGVQFQDSYGRAREFNDVMLDTADALEKAQQRGEMTRPEAMFAGAQAGFSGGMLQLVLSGKGGVQAAIAKQQARTQADDKKVGAANNWYTKSLSLAQSGEAEYLNRGVGAYGGIRGDADEKLENAGKYTADFFASATDKVSAAIDRLTNYLSSLFGGNSHTGQPTTSTAAPVSRGGRPMVGESAWHSTIMDAAKRNGVPPEILAGIIRHESSFNPNAPTSSTGAVGIAQIEPKTATELGIKAGVNPATDIDAAARYLRKQKDYAALHGYEGDKMQWAAAVAMYTAGAGNVTKGTHIGPNSLAYPGAVLRGTPYADTAAGFQFGPGGGNGMTHNEVHVDSLNVTVHTQATDAEGIAGAIGPATQRKLLAAQSEGGSH